MGERDQKVQISGYKMDKSWDVTYSMATIINITWLHIFERLSTE